jgi:hypothetical protein
VRLGQIAPGVDEHRWWSSRQRAQGLVEAAYAAVLLVVVLGLVFDVALWGHAQNVATAAVQDGARMAAAQDGDLDRGRARARDLLAAGLGSSARLVAVTAGEDSQSVTFSARGEWPVITGPGVDVGFPIAAESRMLKHEWRP